MFLRLCVKRRAFYSPVCENSSRVVQSFTCQRKHLSFNSHISSHAPLRLVSAGRFFSTESPTFANENQPAPANVEVTYDVDKFEGTCIRDFIQRHPNASQSSLTSVTLCSLPDLRIEDRRVRTAKNFKKSFLLPFSVLAYALIPTTSTFQRVSLGATVVISFLFGAKSFIMGLLSPSVPLRLGVVWTHSDPAKLVRMRRAWAELVDARDACSLLDQGFSDVLVIVLSAIRGQKNMEESVIALNERFPMTPDLHAYVKSLVNFLIVMDTYAEDPDFLATFYAQKLLFKRDPTTVVISVPHAKLLAARKAVEQVDKKVK